MKHLTIKLIVLIVGIIFILFPSCKKTSNSGSSPAACGSLNDIDGNVYTAIKIGDQCWMQKNLNVSHYRNGNSIPQVQDPVAWVNLTTGAQCYYENNSANGIVYGKLYNWYAVNDPRGLAPAGWHVPSASEWTILTYFLGGVYSIAGSKMKEAGTAHWTGPTGNVGDNSSGFSGLPGGYRSDYLGLFGTLGEHGFWWSSTEATNLNARCRYLDDTDICTDSSAIKIYGYSIRCVRD